MNLRCVIDYPRDCAINMAIDEMFFIKEDFEHIVRFYKWTKPSYTIGYFQKNSDIENKNSCPVIRRMTGGLAVLHSDDLSYSFIVSEKIWKYIYNQEMTYKIIHQTIKDCLAKINIICDNNGKIDTTHKDVACVKTFYKDDLFLNGRKIAGSCQRRRGKKILIEGSIHLKLSDKQTNIFANNFFKDMSDYLSCSAIAKPLTDTELDEAKIIAESKYNTDKWNKLF